MSLIKDEAGAFISKKTTHPPFNQLWSQNLNVRWTHTFISDLQGYVLLLLNFDKNSPGAQRYPSKSKFLPFLIRSYITYYLICWYGGTQLISRVDTTSDMLQLSAGWSTITLPPTFLKALPICCGKEYDHPPLNINLLKRARKRRETMRRTKVTKAN